MKKHNKFLRILKNYTTGNYFAWSIFLSFLSISLKKCVPLFIHRKKMLEIWCSELLELQDISVLRDFNLSVRPWAVISDKLCMLSLPQKSLTVEYIHLRSLLFLKIPCGVPLLHICQYQWISVLLSNDWILRLVSRSGRYPLSVVNVGKVWNWTPQYPLFFKQNMFSRVNHISVL